MSGEPEALMIIVNVPVPVPPALVALRDTDEVPVDVGVPEITAVLVLKLKPAGNPLALKLVTGPLLTGTV